jgi:hypothetical protein
LGGLSRPSHRLRLVFTCPIDVGYPAGTSSWWIAFGAIGVCVHYPVLFVTNAYRIGPGLFRDLVCFSTVYGDLFFLVLILAYAIWSLVQPSCHIVFQYQRCIIQTVWPVFVAICGPICARALK